MSNRQHIWKKIVFFGDSLTQFGWSVDGCWLAQVADKFQRKYDVVNRGFSGYNSKWCNIILPQLYDKSNLFDVEMFVIFVGANDSNLKETNPRQHVSLDEFRIYLQNMCSYLMNCGLRNNQIMIISPPPVDEEKWEITMKAKNDVSSKRLYLCKLYTGVCKSVCEQMKTTFLDLCSIMLFQEDWQSMFNDGLHFSHKGSLFVGQTIIDVLESKLNSDFFHYPHWSDIDMENPFSNLIKN